MARGVRGHMGVGWVLVGVEEEGRLHWKTRRGPLACGICTSRLFAAPMQGVIERAWTTLGKDGQSIRLASGPPSEQPVYCIKTRTTWL